MPTITRPPTTGDLHLSNGHDTSHNEIADAIEDNLDVTAIVSAPTGVASTDTAAINAAITAAGDEGRIVYHAGTYVTNGDHEWKTGHHHSGAGVEATVIQLAASQASGTTVFQSTDFDSLTGTTPTVPADGIHSGSVTDMTIDGNKANQGSATGQVGIQSFGHGLQVRRVELKNFKSHGWQSEWNGNVGPTSGEKVKRHIIDTVTSHDNDGDGFNWSGPTDCKWFGAVAHSNGSNGYNFTSGGGGSGGQQLMACHSWGTGQTYGYLIAGAMVNLIGCQMEIGSTAGVIILANQCTIQGGQVYRNAGASVKGIILGDGSHAVSGCNIDTLVQNANSGSFDFANDAGNNSINVNAYQASGTFVTGTPAASTQCLINGAGGATVPHNHLDLINSTAGVTPIKVRHAASPTVPHQTWEDSTGTRLSSIMKGYYMTRRTAAPADADIATNEMALWFDATAGAAKLMIKAKNASGTVVTGSVNLS